MEAWRGTGDRLGWRPPLSTKVGAGWPCAIGAGLSAIPAAAAGKIATVNFAEFLFQALG